MALVEFVSGSTILLKKKSRFLLADFQNKHLQKRNDYYPRRQCTVRGWMATQYHSIHLELNMFNNTRHATQRWLPTTDKPQCFAVYNIRIHEVLIREHYTHKFLEFVWTVV